MKTKNDIQTFKLFERHLNITYIKISLKENIKLQ